MMLTCFEGDFQSSVSGSGWNEGPDLSRDCSLWPRCGILHSGLWSGSRKMVIACLQPMWRQGHLRCAEVAGGVDSWSCLMLTALSASRSVGIDVHTVEELCGWDSWPVSSVTLSLAMLFQRFLKTKRTNFGSECCSHHIVTDCRCHTLEMLKCLPKSPEEWIGFRIRAGLKAVLGYICALQKQVLNMSGLLVFSLRRGRGFSAMCSFQDSL